MFLSQILKTPIIDASGARVGRPVDLIASQKERFPLISALQVEIRGERHLIPWSVVDSFGDAISLTRNANDLPEHVMEPDEILVRRSIMDKQIVDVHNLRVVRVNDINLAPTNGNLRLIGVDASSRGILRQIGMEKLGSSLARFFHLTLHSHLISWADVDMVDAETDRLRLNVEVDRIHRLHPADIASIIDQLDPKERAEVLEGMDAERAADVIADMEPEAQAQVINSMEEERASDILEEMEPDEAADVLGDLTKEKSDDLLSRMDQDDREEVEELLLYEDESAGGLMTNEYIALKQAMTVDETISYLRETGPDAETIYYLYVVDAEEHLTGVLSLRELIVKKGNVLVEEIMHTSVLHAHTHDSPEIVAQVIARYDLLALPVVDEEGRLVGIVTVDDVVDRYLPQEEWRGSRWAARMRR